MKQILEGNLAGDEMESLFDFFRCINVCHDCIQIADKKGNLQYNGPSVDEVALLEMARDSEFSKFVSRDADSTKILVNGQEETYKVIKVFPFTSERKAMSIVVKHPEKENTAICFVKGADSSVFPMCLGYGGKEDLEGDHPNQNIAQIEARVESMASKGLRTLLYAKKEIVWDGSIDMLDWTVE